MRELQADPARSENLRMYGIFMRENREVPCSSVRADQRADRLGKAEEVSRGCTSMGSQTVP